MDVKEGVSAVDDLVAFRHILRGGAVRYLERHLCTHVSTPSKVDRSTETRKIASEFCANHTLSPPSLPCNGRTRARARGLEPYCQASLIDSVTKKAGKKAEILRGPLFCRARRRASGIGIQALTENAREKI